VSIISDMERELEARMRPGMVVAFPMYWRVGKLAMEAIQAEELRRLKNAPSPWNRAYMIDKPTTMMGLRIEATDEFDGWELEPVAELLLLPAPCDVEDGCA